MEQKFSFALTEEEKQGSLECLQQTHGQMNVMGGVQTRLRVQAQEDVYENTRRSMTQAAQNLKNKWWVNGTTILCCGGLCKPNGKWGFVNVINIFSHFYLLVKASCYSLSFRLLNVVNNSLLIAWDSPLYGGAATFMGTANRKIKTFLFRASAEFSVLGSHEGFALAAFTVAGISSAIGNGMFWRRICCWWFCSCKSRNSKRLKEALFLVIN